ncbi:hypothetical protein V2V90_21420 [Agrobacterium leguminum]
MKIFLEELVIDVFALLDDTTIPPGAYCRKGDFERWSFSVGNS